MRHASLKPEMRATRIAPAIRGFAYLASASTDAAGLPSRRDRRPASGTGGVATG
jgi:hypothetical protein